MTNSNSDENVDTNDGYDGANDDRGEPNGRYDHDLKNREGPKSAVIQVIRRHQHGHENHSA